MSRIALLVGINDYPDTPLSGCVDDARALEAVLTENGDGSPNFVCRRPEISTRSELRTAVEDLFTKSDVDLAVFFFAGHGVWSDTRGGILLTPDAEARDEGVPMSDLVAMANRSPARERIVVLDCCHAGGVDQLVHTGRPVPWMEGCSVLAACRDTEFAMEAGKRGLFASTIEDALSGCAADVRGNVTVASAYAYADQVLGAWAQRPLFRGSLSRLTPIRRAKPSVTDEKLRRLIEFFPRIDSAMRLDPSYEPTEEPRNRDKERDFAHLQQFRAARIIEPVGTPHLYYAAIESKTCVLTPLGRYYWRAVAAKKI